MVLKTILTTFNSGRLLLFMKKPMNPAHCSSVLLKSSMSSITQPEKMRHRKVPVTQLVQPPKGSQSSVLLHHDNFNFIYTLLIIQELRPKILLHICWNRETGCKPCHCSLFLNSLLICFVCSFCLLISRAIHNSTAFQRWLDAVCFGLNWALKLVTKMHYTSAQDLEETAE